MSFERVHRYIMRNSDRTSFVCVKDGRAKCMAAEHKNVHRILIGFYKNIKPVGFYKADVSETDLEQDLKYCGIET